MGSIVLVDSEFVANRHHLLVAFAAFGSVTVVSAGIFAFPTEIENPESLVPARACHVGGLCRASDVMIATSTPVFSNLVPTYRVTQELHNVSDVEQKQWTPIRLFFLGDMMFDRMVARRIAVSKDPAYAFARMSGTADQFFENEDIVIANLEGPVTSKRRIPEKSIDFAFSPTIPSLLKSVGIDAVSQANNHSLDQGREGSEESRRLLTAAGLHVFGDEVHDDAMSALTILESHGQRIAILGFNTTDNPLDEYEAQAAIHEARAKAERVVVYMHWGQEYQSKPSATQVARAHWLIDRGVDVVIGAHPHWMQSVEVYKGRVIAYSLGNFIFDQDWSSETGYGLVAGVVLGGNGMKLYLYPIKIELSQPSVLKGDERAVRLRRLAEISDPALKEQILQGVLTVDQ